jgi:hypothetical protein
MQTELTVAFLWRYSTFLYCWQQHMAQQYKGNALLFFFFKVTTSVFYVVVTYEAQQYTEKAFLQFHGNVLSICHIVDGDIHTSTIQRECITVFFIILCCWMWHIKLNNTHRTHCCVAMATVVIQTSHNVTLYTLPVLFHSVSWFSRI